VLATLIALGSILSGQAKEAGDTSAIINNVLKAPVIEWAPKSAQTIADLPESDRKEFGKALVRAIGERKPTLVPTIVGELSKQEKQFADVFANAGATVTPEYSVDIAIAASKAAPEYAKEIAAAVSVVYTEEEARFFAAKAPKSEAPTVIAEVKAQSAQQLVVAVSEAANVQYADVAVGVEDRVPEFRRSENGKGNAADKIGVGNGRGQGRENGIGTGNNGKPQGNGNPHGTGNGNGRGQINGRGTINAYHRLTGN
jgi:hypothetical protein